MVERSICIANNSSSNVNYCISQLPPQTYIPPPGSALINYSMKSPNSTTSQFPDYSGSTATTNHPLGSVNQQITTAASNQQLTMSQAPPGSNPYPPIPMIDTSKSFTQNSQIVNEAPLTDLISLSEKTTIPKSKLSPVQSQLLAYTVPQSVPSKKQSTSYNQSVPKS